MLSLPSFRADQVKMAAGKRWVLPAVVPWQLVNQPRECLIRHLQLLSLQVLLAVGLAATAFVAPRPSAPPRGDALAMRVGFGMQDEWGVFARLRTGVDSC